MPEATVQEYLGVVAVIASPAMRNVIEQVKRAARSPVSVLISGESGTGKEIVARAVHHYSLRCSQPWVDINCGALPENLIESELFGHERGAFSGADMARPGLFEMAHKGTIFLDEVAELDCRMQVKLLRVLDGVPYFRVGGRKKVSVDVRVVAATNQDLERAVSQHRFRDDLFHRLNEYRIHVPPLRVRHEDVLALARYFLRQHAENASLSPEAEAALAEHPRPGNIRELRNAVNTAAINATSYQITVADLPPAVTARRGTAPPSLSGTPNLDALEREAILAALERTGGRRQHAADLLGISRRTLTRKLKLYGEPEEENSTQELKKLCLLNATVKNGG